MNGIRGLKAIAMDEGLTMLVHAVLRARGVPSDSLDEQTRLLRQSPDWPTVVEQWRCQASDRALMRLIERAWVNA